MMQGLESPTGLDMARCIATARITMPRSVVRLSAGRLELSTSDQVHFLPRLLSIPPKHMVACSLEASVHPFRKASNVSGAAV